MERGYDAAVVGSGAAGTQAARALRDHGWSVAVIDEGPFGGTCALRGCDPKKVLVHAARVIEQAQQLANLRVLRNLPVISWSDLQRFKRTFTDPVPAERERTLQEAGIATLHGRASFEDERTLRVDGELVRAEHVVIATGAEEMHVAQGDDLLLTSDQFLDLEALPESLVFVGGGYIAFEFAHVAVRAGARVTVLNNNAHPLEGFDPDIVERLLDVSCEAGIEIHLETPVTSVERDGDDIVVHAKCNGEEREFRARAGVLAAGRVPNLEHLSLDRVGVERTKKGVKVNEFLQSSNPRIYAAGDAADAGALPLTPVAGYTGELAAKNLAGGNSCAADYNGLATLVYTIPPLGSVGLSESKARERGLDFDVHAGDMTEWYSTRHVAARSAYYKTIVERKTGKLLGVTILGPHAEEQINVFALAIRYSLDAHALSSALFAYPTGSSDVEYFLK